MFTTFKCFRLGSLGLYFICPLLHGDKASRKKSICQRPSSDRPVRFKDYCCCAKHHYALFWHHAEQNFISTTMDNVLFFYGSKRHLQLQFLLAQAPNKPTGTDWQLNTLDRANRAQCVVNSIFTKCALRKQSNTYTFTPSALKLWVWKFNSIKLDDSGSIDTQPWLKLRNCTVLLLSPFCQQSSANGQHQFVLPPI